MSTTAIYEELIKQVTDPLALKVLKALEDAPNGLTRSQLIMQIDGVWVPPAELANNVHDRKIRKAIELLVKKYRCPIASSSGKAGYRLSEDPDEMEEATIKATDTNAETGRCEYCGKERPLDQLKQEAIFRNGREHIGTYCRYDGCANFAQMSAEG